MSDSYYDLYLISPALAERYMCQSTEALATVGRRAIMPLDIKNPIRFFYPTSDDWAPNFPRNCVEITVHVYYTSIDPAKGMIRIVVRGADDTLMEKDYFLPESEYDSKLEEIKSWLHKLPNPLTQKWLETQGFSFQ